MAIVSGNIIIFIVIIFQSSLYSMSFIHANFKGSLTNSWNILLKTYADDIDGMILYCIDSFKNQLVIDIARDGNGNKYVRFKFNKIWRYLPLEEIYGCENCLDGYFYIRIRSVNGKIYAKSNTKLFLSLFIEHGNENNITYPIYVPIESDSETIFAMIGNIGLLNNSNANVVPLKEQMLACLLSFVYNGMSVKFVGGGTDMRASCNLWCVDNRCNEGRCTYNQPYNMMCDCSSTPLNGLFCNKMLKPYVKVSNNYYEKIKDANEVYLKMTWKQSLKQNYCLMEIIRGLNSDIIWTNGTRLMIGSIFIRNIRTEKINFVSVYIANNHLTLKSENVELNFTFSLHENTSINVGFSERNSCSIFSGLYDVYFNKQFLRRIRSRPKVVNQIYSILTDEIWTYEDNKLVTTSTLHKQNLMNMVAFSIIGNSVILVFVVTICFICQRFSKIKLGVVQIANNNVDYEQYSKIDIRSMYTSPRSLLVNSSSVTVTVPPLPPRDEGSTYNEDWVHFDAYENTIGTEHANSDSNCLDYAKIYSGRVNDNNKTVLCNSDYIDF